MKKPEDMFGNTINAGDVIIYSVKGSNYITTRLAVVDKVIEYTNRYDLKVRAYRPSNWQAARIYKTTLTSNRSIIKLNNFHLPEGFKNLLLASIV